MSVPLTNLQHIPTPPHISPHLGCADQMRAYFTQLRQELGQRLVEKVFGQEPKPSKVYT